MQMLYLWPPSRNVLGFQAKTNGVSVIGGLLWNLQLAKLLK